MLLGQVEHHGPKDRNSELSCLTAMTFDGKQLWQIGEPDTWKQHLTNDVAFQIHDLDGDGKSEVVYTLHQELIVAEGATGKTLRKIPTPEVPETAEAVYKKFPRVLGDALLFADFRGTGHASDLVLKDRYYHFWTFDDQLRPFSTAAAIRGTIPMRPTSTVMATMSWRLAIRCMIIAASSYGRWKTSSRITPTGSPWYGCRPMLRPNP